MTTRRRNRLRVLCLPLAAGLLLSALPALALDTGQAMPKIGIADLAGQRIDSASLRGKVVVVDFWATWCAPCKDELPVLQRLQKKYGKQGLVVLAISVDSDAGKVRSFVDKLGLKLRVAHDAEHTVAERYKPAKMPSSYIVDRAGRVRFVHGGFRAGDAKKLETEIRMLLSERAAAKR